MGNQAFFYSLMQVFALLSSSGVAGMTLSFGFEEEMMEKM
jgi:hypothetical protein